MKSRSLCGQRKKAQRLALEPHRGILSAGSRLSADDWTFVAADVRAAHGSDPEADLFALGPGDAPSFG